MGLDLLVESRAKPGHETEWREIMMRHFGGHDSEEDKARFAEIGIPPWITLEAPRVGFDKAADDWILKNSGAETPEEAEEIIEKARGFYVVRAVECDGVPLYCNGPAYGEYWESFRGSFLQACPDVLDETTLARAWHHMMPEQALDYGDTLLAAADAAESAGPSHSPGPDGVQPEPFAEQLAIVRSAGRWYRFWGERAHAIFAWY